MGDRNLITYAGGYRSSSGRKRVSAGKAIRVAGRAKSATRNGKMPLKTVEPDLEIKGGGAVLHLGQRLYNALP